MLHYFFLAFIPLFVAVDPLGLLPIYVSLTQGMNKNELKKIIFQSLVTAMCLAVGFIFVGKAVFKFLGITVGDFMVAGGAILFCIAVIEILQPGKHRRTSKEEVGAVPIGTPLIVGPAVLTTSLILIEEYGVIPTIMAVLVNILITGMVFLSAHVIIRILGQSGTRAASKVMALLLAAIAVMMIRKGIFNILGL